MKTLRLLPLVFCAIAIVTTARATTVIPPSFDQLVQQAELIFEGTVTEVKSQWTGEGAERRIVSFVTFKVNDGLKGEAGDTYTMRMLGGTVDDTTMEVTDSPKFKVGDRDIVFVENNGSQFIPLVGIMHGRFKVQKDQTGAEVVLDNRGHAVTDVAHLGGDLDSALGGKHSHSHTDRAPKGAALSTADFKAAIKAKLANSTR